MISPQKKKPVVFGLCFKTQKHAIPSIMRCITYPHFYIQNFSVSHWLSCLYSLYSESAHSAEFEDINSLALLR